jgi:hypothetical protein
MKALRGAIVLTLAAIGAATALAWIWRAIEHLSITVK